MTKIEAGKYYATKSMDFVFEVVRAEDFVDRDAVAVELRDFAYGFTAPVPQCHGFDVYNFAYPLIHQNVVELSREKYLYEWQRLTKPTFEKMRSDHDGCYYLNFKRQWFPPDHCNYTTEDVIRAELAARGLSEDAVKPKLDPFFQASAAAYAANMKELLAVERVVACPTEPCVCVIGRSRACRAHPGE